MDKREVCLLQDLQDHTSRSVFTPDGRHIVSAPATSCKSIIYVHDACSGKLNQTMQGHTSNIWDLAVTSDSLHIVSASADKTARVWFIASGKVVRTLFHRRPVNCVALTADNRHIITGSNGHTNDIYVWRMNNGALVRKIKQTINDDDSVINLHASRDGLYIVSGSAKTVCVWRLADGSLLHKIKLEGDHSICHEAVMPDSDHIVTGCSDSTIRMFETTTGKPTRAYLGHEDRPVWWVAVSADGRYLASCWSDAVCVWCLSNPSAKPLVLTGHLEVVFGVAFHPNGKQVVVYGKTVCIWTICEWSDRDHQLFGPEFKALVFHLMCAKARLDALTEQKTCLLPRLPMAIWLQVFASLYDIY